MLTDLSFLSVMIMGWLLLEKGICRFWRAAAMSSWRTTNPIIGNRLVWVPYIQVSACKPIFVYHSYCSSYSTIKRLSFQPTQPVLIWRFPDVFDYNSHNNHLGESRANLIADWNWKLGSDLFLLSFSALFSNFILLVPGSLVLWRYEGVGYLSLHI